MSHPIASPLEADPIPDPPAGDLIFTPLRFRNLEVKNRIFRSNISGRFDNEDGSLTQTRINWECKFAKGGVGAIISSYVPVLMEGRIIAGLRARSTATTSSRCGRARQGGAQLRAASSSCSSAIPAGRWTCPGVSQPAPPDAVLDQPQGTAARLPLPGDAAKGEIERADRGLRARRLARARGRARRRRAACRERLPVHPVPELRDQRPHRRVWRLAGNRARFLLEVIRAIRAEVGRDFHLQVKLSAIDRNNVIPWEGKGNTLADTIAGRAVVRGGGRRRAARLDRLAVSASAQSAGRLLVRDLADDLRRDDLLRRLRVPQLPAVPLQLLRPIFRWLWFRMKRGLPIEGVSLDEARAIKAAVSIPVLNTGGWQTASYVRDGDRLRCLRRRLDRALAGRQQRPASSGGRAGTTSRRRPAPTATRAWSTRRRIRWAATSRRASRP